MVPPAQPTQMLTLPISSNASIESPKSPDGKIWSAALDILESTKGFRRVYWGRHVERENVVQLHIVRETMEKNYLFLGTPEWSTFQNHISRISVKTDANNDLPIVRHAILSDFSPSCKSLAKGAPVTGTAIYMGISSPQWEKAWDLWTTVVPSVQGCLGIAGGPIVEPVQGHDRNYIAWVGWENTEVHDVYHETKHYRRNANILFTGNKGFSEYGHVAFTHSRAKRVEML